MNEWLKAYKYHDLVWWKAFFKDSVSLEVGLIFYDMVMIHLFSVFLSRIQYTFSSGYSVISKGYEVGQRLL